MKEQEKKNDRKMETGLELLVDLFEAVTVSPWETDGVQSRVHRQADGIQKGS